MKDTTSSRSATAAGEPPMKPVRPDPFMGSLFKRIENASLEQDAGRIDDA
jgi:hypothetical protein